MVKITLSLLLLIQTNLLAQIDTTQRIPKKNPNFAKTLILPTSLCVVGIIVKETNFREYFQKKVQDSRFSTNTTIDNYIQYAPIAELYIADIYFSKTKTEVFQQTKNLAIAEIFTAIIVQTIKHTMKVKRPNGHDFSFFSGHTSQSFTGATALYLEYKDSNKGLALSGYGFSTATGILRVTNNKHWLSDVIVGAGIGMLATTLVWYINPFEHLDPFKKRDIKIYPIVSSINSNIGVCIVF